MSQPVVSSSVVAPTVDTPFLTAAPAVRDLFPTPVITAQVNSADWINAELTRTILQREKTHPSVQYSNSGGWQSSWDFADWSGEAGKRLLDTVKAIAGHFTSDRSGPQLKDIALNWKINAWANINRRGNANEMHTHAGAFWSGCYYVNDAGAGVNGVGGEFEIIDPRGPAPMMYAPTICCNAPNHHTAGLSEFVVPQAGMLVMFPSWMYHAVRAYRGDGTRISVAFNLSCY